MNLFWNNTNKVCSTCFRVLTDRYKSGKHKGYLKCDVNKKFRKAWLKDHNIDNCENNVSYNDMVTECFKPLVDKIEKAWKEMLE